MRNLLVAFSIIMLLAMSVSAETFRQGDVRYTYNQSDAVTKTAAYTMTATDGLVKVTASSADIVITLPAISSLRPNTKAYKILKTDATSWNIVVTPAAGDTIGGESTRYLTYANAYMIIGTSSGNPTNWQVIFESPLVVEDYEVGTVTLAGQAGGLKLVETVTATATLTRADCGKTVFLNHATTGIDMTLPLPTKGCYFKFVVILAFGDDHQVLTSAGADIMIGGMAELETDTGDDGPSDANADAIQFVDTAETVGDYVEMISDGVSWYYNGQSVLDGAFTTSTT